MASKITKDEKHRHLQSNVLFQCPACAALVQESGAPQHAAWHKQRGDALPLASSFERAIILPSPAVVD